MTFMRRPYEHGRSQGWVQGGFHIIREGMEFFLLHGLLEKMIKMSSQVMGVGMSGGDLDPRDIELPRVRRELGSEVIRGSETLQSRHEMSHRL